MEDNKYLDSDWRSLELHQLIVERINKNPDLIIIPKENLDRWRQNRNGLPPCLVEWETILKNKSWDDVSKILLGTTQDCARLRSSTPFVGILTQEERMKIFYKWSKFSCSKSGEAY